MENKTIRIKANPSDPKEHYLTAKLEQDFEKIEVLSLTLKQNDIYRSFTSDYGVIVGRVSTAGGTGLPNCRVNVFIPISDEDKLNPDKFSIYPYTTPLDKNNKGKKFNLLSKLKRLNPFSGFKENTYGIGYKPKTPVGSIPDKIEILTNNTWLEIYQDYYKYSSITNGSGDYMIFGVPIGNQIVTMSCDITDIGQFSSSIPILAQVQGLGENLFTEDGTKLKDINDLDSVPTVQQLSGSINVIPFCGDSTLSEIGITRKDFEIRTKINPIFTLTGAGFTGGENNYSGNRIVFQANLGLRNLCLWLGNACDYSDDSPGIKISIGAKLKIGFSVLRNRIDIFNNQYFGSGDGSACPDLENNGIRICICFKVVIKNLLPFFCVKSLFYSNCEVNGGLYDSAPISINWLGATGLCLNSCTELEQKFATADILTTTLDLDGCRTGLINETIYTYKPTVSNEDIDNKNTDINEDIVKLNTNEYAKIKSPDGTFLYQFVCNRDFVVTDEFGNQILTGDPNKGLPIGFYGYGIFSLDGPNISSSGAKIITDRVRIKIPSCEAYNAGSWVKSAYYFKANEVYSVAQYFNVSGYDNNAVDYGSIKLSERTGILLDVNTLGIVDDANYGDDMEMIHNQTISLSDIPPKRIFVNRWLNGCLYFHQVGYKKRKGKRQNYVCNKLISDAKMTLHNGDPLGGNTSDSYFILNNGEYPTNFVQLDKDNLVFEILPNQRRGIRFNSNQAVTLMKTGPNDYKYVYKGLYDYSDGMTNFLKKDIV